ncbi:MAG: aspartate kinase [Spirochaetae bacterium HGW-Spirochaetae-3]|jgi:aspartate kinase|nr:MAG: aspartate kinase [Spirochaetae bacterium HGW-Spirochaetae-3]
MALIVQKFGGTSVADPAARERMLEKVTAARARGDRVIVVVSAMGRKGAPYATDTLLGLLDEAGAAQADGPGRDLLATCGETISACLVAARLTARGVKSVPMTAYTAGIRASGSYGDAEISDVDADRILAVVDSGSVPVITGFQAVAPNGCLVTIGRGGSDTSAVAVGAWTKADFVDIYTDVPGVATADPRLVPEAPFLERLDYRSMYRLASNGARVLHDRSALLGERFGVSIRVRSTFDDGDGTLISAEPLPPGSPAVLGIAADKSAATATVAIVCKAGGASSIAATAAAAAATAGGAPVQGSDADVVAFSCAANDVPGLVKALFEAVAVR